MLLAEEICSPPGRGGSEEAGFVDGQAGPSVVDEHSRGEGDEVDYGGSGFDAGAVRIGRSGSVPAIATDAATSGSVEECRSTATFSEGVSVIGIIERIEMQPLEIG